MAGGQMQTEGGGGSSFIDSLTRMINEASAIGKARVRKKYPGLYDTNPETGEMTPKSGVGNFFGNWFEGMEAVEEYKKLARQKAIEAAFEGLKSAGQYAAQGVSAGAQGIASGVNWLGSNLGIW